MCKKMMTVLLSALLILGLMTVPGSAQKRGEIKVGVVDWAAWHWWNKLVADGIAESASKLGVKPVFTDANIDHVRQSANVDNLISQGVDAMIFIIGDEVAMKPMVAKARRAGIKTIFVGGGTAIPDILCSILSDDYRIGYDLAEWMIHKIGGSGNIVVFQNPSQDSTRLRYEGLQAALAKYPKVKVIEDRVLEWTGDRLNAMKITETLMKKYPKGQLKAVWAAWDAPAYGAAEAAQAAGRTEVFSVGVNGELASMNAIRDGLPVGATVAQRPKEFGRTAMEMAFLAVTEDRTLPREIVFPHLIYHKGNLPASRDDLGISGE